MAPWASFLPMLRASGMLGQRWHHIGLMFSHFRGILWFVLALLGKSWDHIGLILGHFGLCWDILGHVGTILGSCWAILGYFRICVGLCFGLGHFNVVKFSSIPGVCKNHQKYQEKMQAAIFRLFLFLSWGMLQLGYVCLISGLCWAIVGYVGTILGSCWAIMLGHFVVFCGLRLPLLSHFRGILWFGSAFVGQELGPY